MPEQGRLMPAIDLSGKSISGMADVGDMAVVNSIQSVSAEMDCRTGYREGKAKREAGTDAVGAIYLITEPSAVARDPGGTLAVRSANF